SNPTATHTLLHPFPTRRSSDLYPNDLDVGAFFAEAMMDLRPWNQWTPEGQPTPGTNEILSTLERVLKLNPRHPFANHLYIHANRSEEHTSELQSLAYLVCRLLL